MLSRFSNGRRGAQRGLSIVEFLVGVAVGLFIVGGATKLFVDYVVDSRRVLLEARLHQDLRAAADLIVRDLRRAGYWNDSMNGIIAAGAASAPLNPFRTITVTNNDLTAGELTYTYDRAASSAGFKVEGGALKMLNGDGGWQAVTDTTSLFITAASLSASSPVLRTVDLYASCPCFARVTNPCTAASFASGGANYANRPRLTLRQYTLTLEGYAPSASNIQREIQETVRVRNDATDGFCPA